MSQNKKIDKSARVLFSVFKENNVDQLGAEVLTILSKISSKSQKFKQFLSTKRIELNTKKEIGAFIITGSGEKAFAAGSDISQIKEKLPND